MLRDPAFRAAALAVILVSGVAVGIAAMLAGASLSASHDDRVRQGAPADDGAREEALRSVIRTAAIGWLATLLPSLLALWLLWRREAGLLLALNEPKAVFPRDMGGVMGDLARRIEDLSEKAEELEARHGAARREAEAILASMSEAVVAVDAGQRIRVANASAGRLLGFEPAQAQGQAVGSVVRAEAIAETAALASRGEARRARVDLPGPPPRVLDMQAEPIRPGGGAVLVLRDVTEEARFAEMRRDFVASASHELRTPLTVIRGTVETLLDGGLEHREKAVEFLQAMERQVRTLTALVNDMLDLGKLESRPEFAPRATDLGDVLEKAAALYEDAAKKKDLSIAVSIGDGLPGMMADPGLLERAFSNLVDNAVRYTPAGGRIEVVATGAGSWARVEIRDTGIGIPEKDLKRVFERFYRVDRSRSREAGGTGLGLAIVKHIVALHKGEVWAEGEFGKGTTIVVRLPGFG
jgi:two-component system phosphate regulon sensor histidine kinase PhoR